MTLDRMELADCATPELLVATILKQVPDLPIPVPVETIARELGISDIKRLSTEAFEGGLIALADKTDGVILVNSRSNPRRQRFTVGHELGHFLNYWHKASGPDGFRCTSRDMGLSKARDGDRATKMEVEANRFSADLLFPRPYFRKDLARMRIVDVEHIVTLAERYDMSKESTARRYVQEHDEPTAVVVSQHGKAQRIYRHKSFPFVECSPGSPVPAASATAQAAVKESEATGWIEVDGGVWLASRRGRRSPKLYEQVLGQQGGFRLTLITLDDDYASEGDEDEDGAWSAPTFHR